MLVLLFADKAERLVAEAAGNESQLVVFPEAFVGGYPRGFVYGVSMSYHTTNGREHFRKYHSTAIDVPGRSFLIHLYAWYKIFNVVLLSAVLFRRSLHWYTRLLCTFPTRPPKFQRAYIVEFC